MVDGNCWLRIQINHALRAPVTARSIEKHKFVYHTRPIAGISSALCPRLVSFRCELDFQCHMVPSAHPRQTKAIPARVLRAGPRNQVSSMCFCSRLLVIPAPKSVLELAHPAVTTWFALASRTPVPVAQTQTGHTIQPLRLQQSQYTACVCAHAFVCPK